MVGMAIGGFLGGFLYDVSNSYVSAWLVSFMCGVISSLIAMDLMVQGERVKAAQAALAPISSEATPAKL
jgi:MFS family permease